jgi:GNAT superfamily N-acetyltransferase
MAATSETFVRAARASDADALADLQLDCWREAYAGVLPPGALARLVAGRDEIVERWRSSAVEPPGPRYHVLVAVHADAVASTVVGMAALGPAEEPVDVNPAVVAELLVLEVAAAHRGAGHGTRLLAAAVDHLRADGFVQAVLWVDDGDSASAGLLQACGWARDGTTRTLDLDGDGAVLVHQSRWHTDLTPHSAPEDRPAQEDRP